jgi:tRNA dimethylallyltransferase
MANEAEHNPPSSILHPRPLLLAGPTAVGKSEIALSLAGALGGEIVSVDSMQVYRGMDLGTAKASPAERARVPHHLVDVVELTQSFDAAQFVRLAHEAVTDIQRRGHAPILCGGTGLYFKAFLEGLGEAPPADAALRDVLGATPLTELLRELAESDPATYERIDRQNPRRVIRAVEVIRLTGKPFSAQRAQWRPSSLPAGPSPLCIGLARSPADLHQRIEARVDGMFRRGWVAETQHLLQQGLAEHKTAMQALGYRQIVEHLSGGRSLPATIDLVKLRTRQFAKRQMTWFRRQLPLTWISLDPQSNVESIVQMILEKVGLPAKDAKRKASRGDAP